MRISGSYRIPAPRRRVFGALIDADVLKACIPGCEELSESGDNVYRTRLKLGLAGLKGNYEGTARITGQNPPESLTLSVEGKGGPGFARGSGEVHLVEDGDETAISCDADAQVGGVLAAVGSRLIQAGARKMMDDFFRCLATHLAESHP